MGSGEVKGGTSEGREKKGEGAQCIVRDLIKISCVYSLLSDWIQSNWSNPGYKKKKGRIKVSEKCKPNNETKGKDKTRISIKDEEQKRMSGLIHGLM
jgi:hypothetical protein